MMLFAQDFRSTCAPLFCWRTGDAISLPFMTLAPQANGCWYEASPSGSRVGGMRGGSGISISLGFYIVHGWQAERGCTWLYCICLYLQFSKSFSSMSIMSRILQRLCVLGYKNLFVGLLLSSWKFLRFIAPPRPLPDDVEATGKTQWSSDSTMTWCDSAWGC